MDKNKTIQELELSHSLELDIKIPRPRIARKVCQDHDIIWALMNMPCPVCGRKSFFAYDYENKN